jgi:hypothetical protein
VAITMMQAPFFFQSMRELHLNGLLMTACPVVLLLILCGAGILKRRKLRSKSKTRDLWESLILIVARTCCT